MLNIAFLGTPDFAVPSLNALHQAGYALTVFTQPDRPSGRGNKTTMPPVKEFALKHDIPVFQFNKIKSESGVAALRALAPDLIVTAAFGQILSAEILSIPRLGCINVHGSLLPAYRGAAPIQWALMQGETVTGITTMFTDVGLDTGDMLLKQEVAIEPEDTAESLFDKLSHVGAQVLLQTLDCMQKGELNRQKQQESEASYFPMIKKSMAEMDFSKTAVELVNLVRGMYSWPIAYTTLEEGKVKIHRASALAGTAPCGTVVAADSDAGLVFGCGDGLLKAEIIQFAGKRAMRAEDYLRGHCIQKGQVAQKEVNNDQR